MYRHRTRDQTSSNKATRRTLNIEHQPTQTSGRGVFFVLNIVLSQVTAAAVEPQALSLRAGLAPRCPRLLFSSSGPAATVGAVSSAATGGARASGSMDSCDSSGLCSFSRKKFEALCLQLGKGSCGGVESWYYVGNIEKFRGDSREGGWACYPSNRPERTSAHFLYFFTSSCPPPAPPPTPPPPPSLPFPFAPAVPLHLFSYSIPPPCLWPLPCLFKFSFVDKSLSPISSRGLVLRQSRLLWHPQKAPPPLNAC